MKKLSRISGFGNRTVQQDVRLSCSIADLDGEMEESFYSSEELQIFRTYVILAEADERKRGEAMRYKRRGKIYPGRNSSRLLP